MKNQKLVEMTLAHVEVERSIRIVMEEMRKSKSNQRTFTVTGVSPFLLKFAFVGDII